MKKHSCRRPGHVNYSLPSHNDTVFYFREVKCEEPVKKNMR